MFVLNHMTREPVSASPDTPVTELLRLMHDRAIRHFPVVDQAGAVIGLVTDRELLSIAQDAGGAVGRTAADVMCPDPMTITADVPLGTALMTICEQRLSALPVVSEGRLVGIITRGDLLNVMCRLLGLDRPGACFDVALLECDADLSFAFSEIQETRIQLISAIAACMRDDGDEPVLYLRADRRDRKAVETALSRAGLILLVPENESTEVAQANPMPSGGPLHPTDAPARSTLVRT